MNTRTVLSLSMALSLALVAGCGGPSVTQEHSNAAAGRISVLKAGTEWSMAEQAFLAGDLDKALKKVENSLKINDTVVKSHVLKGRIMFEMGSVGEALKSLKLAAFHGPMDPEANYYMALVYERLGEIDLARIAYQAACENDDMNPAYAVAVAEMFIDLGQHDEAMAFLTSVPTFEHHAGIRQTLGHLSMMNNDYMAAVEFFEEGQLLAPEDFAIQQDLVFAYVESGRFADAEFVLVSLLGMEDFETRRDLKHMRARCLVEVNRPVEARTIFQKLTSGTDGASDIEAWIGLGNTAFLLNDERSLRRAGARVISMASHLPDGYTLMALYHRRVGAMEDSLANIELSLDIDSQDASAHAFRGLVLADLGQMVASIEAFKIATELEPTNRDYLAMLDWANLGDFATVPTDSQ